MEKKELKAWAAIAEYMQSFEDTDKDGIANVPEYYDTTHERKVADNSKNIINLIKHPNKFAIAIVGICIVAVGVILLLIFGIVKIIKCYNIVTFIQKFHTWCVNQYSLYHLILKFS